MPLFVVATPIGNLDEASPRMKQVLVEAQLVLCEDTRRTRTLFSALGLEAPKLVSCHAHNERERIDTVLALLQQGQNIALVSDAGMPGVSDPGGTIVAAAHDSIFLITIVFPYALPTIACWDSGNISVGYHPY